ncbi:MAG: metallophosphoesterase [Elusimicrobia bacterium]|nr:metallophosphoesterase [Elusimicrobiota bacterium]
MNKKATAAFFLLSFSFQPLALLQGATFARGPYLENMSSEMVAVRFRLDTATSAWITYGAWPDCERFMTTAPFAAEQKITLFGLLADTTHCYRIYLPADQGVGVSSPSALESDGLASSYADSDAGPMPDVTAEQPAAGLPPQKSGGKTGGAVYKAFEGTFRTFRDADKPYFDFLAFGDSGSGSEEQLAVAAQMDKFNPDFVLNTGDVLETGLDSDADAQYFKPYAKMLSREPFFLTLGNHDYGEKYNKEEGKGFVKANYQSFHSVPLTGLPPHYYFFDIGDARFFVLDTNSFYGAKFAPSLAPGSKQYKWLDYFLGKTAKAWKFIVLHHPLYSTGAYGWLEPERAALEPLFLKYDVDMVLQGYNHNYERTKPMKEGLPDDENGIVYVTLGGGGQLVHPQRENEDWSDKFLPVYHFAYFELRDKSLTMTVYDKGGQVIDNLAIQK